MCVVCAHMCAHATHIYTYAYTAPLQKQNQNPPGVDSRAAHPLLMFPTSWPREDLGMGLCRLPLPNLRCSWCHLVCGRCSVIIACSEQGAARDSVRIYWVPGFPVILTIIPTLQMRTLRLGVGNLFNAVVRWAGIQTLVYLTLKLELFRACLR